MLLLDYSKGKVHWEAKCFTPYILQQTEGFNLIPTNLTNKQPKIAVRVILSKVILFPQYQVKICLFFCWVNSSFLERTVKSSIAKLLFCCVMFLTFTNLIVFSQKQIGKLVVTGESVVKLYGNRFLRQILEKRKDIF